MIKHFTRRPFVMCAFLLGVAISINDTALAQVCSQPPAGLIGWWDGDAVAGATAEDIQGTHDGALINGATTVPGKVGDAFSFDGINDYVGTANNPFSTTQIGSSGSLETWVNFDSLPAFNDGSFAADVGGWVGVLYGLGNTDTTEALKCRLHDVSGKDRVVNTISPSVGQWYHVVATWDSANLSCYVNGVLQGSIATAGGIDPDLFNRPFTIGAAAFNPNERLLHGSVDEVTVYGQPLTAQEIQNIFSAGSAGKCKPGANQNPVADAGPDQTIRTLGATVTLDGGGSFDDNTSTENLLYSWRLTNAPAGSGASLTDANTANPTFVADISGIYEAELIVTDEAGLASAPDTVSVSSVNLAPTADAGSDQVAPVGAIVPLDGSGSSDPENDPLDYSWTFGAIPPGSAASLVGGNTRNPYFTPDIAGQYSVLLSVADAIGAGTPDSAEIMALEIDDFVNRQITNAAAIIAGLPLADVTTKGNKQAMLNFLREAAAAIQVGDFARAINKLSDALERTDGCALRGAPDGNGPGRDWIVNCAAQAEIHPLLSSAIAALS